MKLINQVASSSTATDSTVSALNAIAALPQDSQRSFAQTLQQQFAQTASTRPQTAKTSSDKPAEVHKSTLTSLEQNPDASPNASAPETSRTDAEKIQDDKVINSDVDHADQQQMVIAQDANALVVNATLSPWMQSMLEMRQSFNHSHQTDIDNVGSDDALALTAGLVDSRLSLNSIGAENARQLTSGFDAQALPTQLAETNTPSEMLTNTVTDAGQYLRSEEMSFAALENARQENNQLDMTPFAAPLSTQNMPLMLESTSAVVSAQISAPFANQERWQSAINQHVVTMAGNGDEIASLTLSPPDLGPIQVVLKVDNQSVNTTFISDNPLVRQALEDGLQNLRDRMQSQGLQLGQSFIGDGQQAQQHFNSQPQSGLNRQRQVDGQNEDANAIQSSVPKRVRVGVVDTFA